MHELSIAINLADVAAEAARDAAAEAPIEAVRIRVGDLSGVVVEALVSAWEIAAAETPCAAARLEIERVPGRIRCDACGFESDLPQPPRFVCPRCANGTTRVVSGRELDLIALVVSDEPAPEPRR